MRVYVDEALRGAGEHFRYGLTPEIVDGAVRYVYRILDAIDGQLVSGGGERLSELVELANLSAIIGNLFRTGIVQSSNGKFKSNTPHTYPDLLANDPSMTDIEIKVALEANKPKGHLVKPGPHITIRYVLAAVDGTFLRGKANRGVVPWIWEIRAGHLDEHHFGVSNTDGDSGKTAVINAEGMEALTPVYFDARYCPLARPTIRFHERQLI
jgi:hypothetical protein